MWLVAALAAVLVVAGIGIALVNRQPGPAASTPSETTTTTPTTSAERTSTPTPTADGYAANTATYDVTTLPQVNVFAVIPALPVDDDPFTMPLTETAVARGVGAPVWADPADEPVAYVPHEYPYGGTVLPVVERQEHWVKVLLTGRRAMPSAGDPGQVTGWLRTADVDVTPSAGLGVVVSIANRTIDIVHADGAHERIANDFAWGADATPTPVGRTFVMTTRTVPEYAYTRGHPIVYWAVQSPTLEGFDGADVAPAAFHYHDTRSGPVSNGCIRVDPDAITRLSALPPGTPVMITP
ncbi:L,D-transpeptidase [Microbacterium jejuense]|uniref:L,D-transpeptidase n=1 Tax=Microbacterium jejuense TaxID=1263637 RepID=A0ABS7HNU0_9MICO|nr:L,D-transpeptidase [Microbacterium jejuense]